MPPARSRREADPKVTQTLPCSHLCFHLCGFCHNQAESKVVLHHIPLFVFM